MIDYSDDDSDISDNDDLDIGLGMEDFIGIVQL